MKRWYKRVLALGTTLLASAGTLLAQPYSFDENGHGLSYVGSPTGTPLPFQVAPDPTGLITTSPVLIYSLGAPVVSGELVLVQPGYFVDALLCFYTPLGSSTSDMIFYAPINGTLAGVGIPGGTPPSPNTLAIAETGSQTIYRPSDATQPGAGGPVAVPFIDVFQYTFITATPEPSTTALLVVAGGIGLIYRGYRRKCRC